MKARTTVTDDLKAAMIKMRLDGATVREVADHFNVSYSHLYRILMPYKSGKVSGSHWSPEDDKKLIKMYPRAKSADVYAAFPGRSRSSVRMRARALGVFRAWRVKPNKESITRPVVIPTATPIAVVPAVDRREMELAAIAKFERERGINVMPAARTPELIKYNDDHPLVYDHHSGRMTRNPVAKRVWRFGHHVKQASSEGTR